jgi:hypothetical protein
MPEKAPDLSEPGNLPEGRPVRTWGGPGNGATCALCRAPVKLDELELELEFTHQAPGHSPERYHVHVRCFTAWEQARRGAERNGEPLHGHLNGSPGGSSASHAS